MTARVRPYVFYDVALSICSVCYRELEGEIVFQGNNVSLLKHCPEHGPQRVLISDDVDYYRRCREVFIKRPEMPVVYNTPVKWMADSAPTTSSTPVFPWSKLRIPAIFAAPSVTPSAAPSAWSTARSH